MCESAREKGREGNRDRGGKGGGGTEEEEEVEVEKGGTGCAQ